jgi:hypothetical protein
MVKFQNQPPIFGTFWKTFEYILIAFMVIWSSLWRFALFNYNLVYFVVFYYIYYTLYIFGILHYEKSGNPGFHSARHHYGSLCHFPQSQEKFFGATRLARPGALPSKFGIRVLQQLSSCTFRPTLATNCCTENSRGRFYSRVVLYVNCSDTAICIHRIIYPYLIGIYAKKLIGSRAIDRTAASLNRSNELTSAPLSIKHSIKMQREAPG